MPFNHLSTTHSLTPIVFASSESIPANTSVVVSRVPKTIVHYHAPLETDHVTTIHSDRSARFNHIVKPHAMVKLPSLDVDIVVTEHRDNKSSVYTTAPNSLKRKPVDDDSFRILTVTESTKKVKHEK